MKTLHLSGCTILYFEETPTKFKTDLVCHRTGCNFELNFTKVKGTNRATSDDPTLINYCLTWEEEK